MYLVKMEDLKKLLDKWSTKYDVYAPQREDGQVMLLPYGEGELTMDYINFPFPVKEYIFAQREVVFSWKMENGSITTETPKYKDTAKKIFFGIRPCDAYGISYMDKFFIEGYNDNFYGRRRKDMYIAAVNCVMPGENCFCSSTGTGPFAESGYDVLFTPKGDSYIIEAGSEKGEELIASAGDLLALYNGDVQSEKALIEKDVKDKFKTKLNTDNPGQILKENFNHPVWERIAKDCIGCTGCTNVCPTCTCFNVVEEKTGENSGVRVKCWDSCQSESFTRNAGEHNPRNKVSRVRYRIYDKLKYIEDKFGYKGCTGCGRCIDVCTASINMVKVVNEIVETPGKKGDE